MKESVIIVGAGPVGLTSGLLLAKAGIQVTIIEAESGIVPSPRAVGYAWPLLDGLEYHGLFDDMLAAGFLMDYRATRVFRTGEVIMQDLAVLQGIANHPYTLTLGQDRLAEILLAHIQRQPSARILWNTRFVALKQDGDGVTVDVESEGPSTLRTDWLVAADGGRSAVRKAVGLSFDGVTWPRRFVATNVRYPFERFNYPSGYLIDPVFGAVISQVQANGLWRVTFSESDDLPLDEIEGRIDAYLRQVLPGGGDYELQLHSAYSMHQRSAPTYRAGRVLLSGDAAHSTNPTSGFGLVGGMFDSFALSEALIAHLKGDVGEEILDHYAHTRRTTFLTVSSPISTESMRMVFYNDQPERLEVDLIALRARAEDKAASLQAAMVPAALETPSLVDGRRLAEKLAARGRTPGPVPEAYAGKFIRPAGPIKVGPRAKSLYS